MSIASLFMVTHSAVGHTPSASIRAGNLIGYHLNITTVNQPGFTNMMSSDGSMLPPSQWTGYFVDLMAWIATQSGMNYTLSAPTGLGSKCSTSSSNAGNYGCAQQDVTEVGVTDMYLGLFYVTASRLEAGLMTRTYTGDAGIAVAQKGGATDTLDEYQVKQAAGTVGKLCTLTGAAFTDWVAREYPAISQVAVQYSEYVPKLKDGTCDAFVVDRPIALQIAAENCDVNIGVGPSTTYGYHDCAIGMRSDLSDEAIAISYWVEWLRTCSPNDANDPRCYNQFNLDTLYTKWGIAPNLCPAPSPSPSTVDNTTGRLQAILGVTISTLALVLVALVAIMIQNRGAPRAVVTDHKVMMEKA
jgi:hypothetical protein